MLPRVRRAGGVGQHGIDNQTVSIFHPNMAHVAEPGGLTTRVLEQSRIGIRDRGMGRVASLLAAEIAFSVAPLRHWLDALPSAGAAAVVAVVGFNAALRLEAFHARPGLN